MKISEIFIKCGGYKELGLKDSNNYPDFYSIYDVLVDFYHVQLDIEAGIFIEFVYRHIKGWDETGNRSFIDVVVDAHNQRKLELHQIIINLILESSSKALSDDQLCKPTKIKKEIILDQALVIMMNLTFDNRTSIDNAALKASYQLRLKYGKSEYLASTLSIKYADLVRKGVVKNFHDKWRENEKTIEERYRRIESFPMPSGEIREELEGSRR